MICMQIVPKDQPLLAQWPNANVWLNAGNWGAQLQHNVWLKAGNRIAGLHIAPCVATFL